MRDAVVAEKDKRFKRRACRSDAPSNVAYTTLCWIRTRGRDLKKATDFTDYTDECVGEIRGIRVIRGLLRTIQNVLN